MTYHIEHTVMDAGSYEIIAAIEYTYSPGTADTWEEPGDPAEAEIQRVTLRRINTLRGVNTTIEPLGEAPAWMVRALADDESVYDDMVSNADGDDGYDG